MAYCSKCGEKMEEIRKEEGKSATFHCSIHGLDKHPVHQYIGRTNPGNKGGRDWGFILEGR